jgi:hypothetical protein
MASLHYLSSKVLEKELRLLELIEDFFRLVYLVSIIDTPNVKARDMSNAGVV